MTDEERKEAERLAKEYHDSTLNMPWIDLEEVFVQGYAAACEAKRAQHKRQVAINTEDEAQLWAERTLPG